MSLSDPIADMLTRIRNASRAKHDSVTIPASRLKLAILDILKKEGFVEDFKEVSENGKKDIEVKLKYFDRKPVIRQMERVSSPGRRYYVKAKDLKSIRNNIGIAIVSTSHGVMTGRKAKSMEIGGEIICKVW